MPRLLLSPVVLLASLALASVALPVACSSSSGDATTDASAGDAAYADARGDDSALADGGASDSGSGDGPANDGGNEGGPPRGDVIVANQPSPRGVAVDDTYVYWANNGTSDSERAILKAPLAGGAATPLVTGLAGPIVYLADANYVYFVEFVTGDGSIKRVAKAGGAAQTIAPTVDAFALTFSSDATSIVFGTRSGKIQRVPTGGGSVTDLVTGQGIVYGVATNADYIYFTTGITTGGPSPAPTSTDYTLKRAPATGGAATTLYTPAFSQGQLYGVALASGNIVFANTYDNRVYSLPNDGGLPVHVATGSQPSQLVSDGTAAFWIDHLGSSGGSIGRVALVGTPVSPTVAYDQSGPYGIAQGTGYVYWANRIEGTIRRIAK